MDGLFQWVPVLSLVFSALILPLVNMTYGRIRELEKTFQSLALKVAGDHPTRDEVRRMISDHAKRNGEES